ncbi:MAG: hypothetical protein HYT79_03780 [Elusimicrobia bacterium]|nr:hypothetical protein [Elusimicrobiota bacterium]
MKSNIYYLGLIALGAVARVLPHPPNFTPTGAIAFFGGNKLTNKWAAFLAPLAILALSDLVIGLHGTLPFVYASFLITVALGRIMGSSNAGRVLGLGLSSAIFFIISNFGVWLGSGMYPHTGGGLWSCYLAALPFFRNELAANFLYGGAFFLAAGLIEKNIGVLSRQKQTA